MHEDGDRSSFSSFMFPPGQKMSLSGWEFKWTEDTTRRRREVLSCEEEKTKKIEDELQLTKTHR